MKKNLVLLFAPAVLFLASCGNSKSNDDSTVGMKEVKLVILGDSLSIMVPDSLQGTLEITEQSWGATEIKIGEKFQVSIEQNNGDVALTKSDINGDDVYKLKQFITDEPNLLVWESKIVDMEQSNFHFYLVHKIGKTSYVIKDVDSGEAYNESEIQSMLKTAKTLKNEKVTEEKPNA